MLGQSFGDCDVAVTSQCELRRSRTSLREALDLRIADFKGCVLLPLLLLLFEKPSTFCRRRLTPEIEFSNSFRGL